MQELLPNKENVVSIWYGFSSKEYGKNNIYLSSAIEDYTELKRIKYGFHGTSHKYVSKLLTKMLGKEESRINCMSFRKWCFNFCC